MKIGVWFYGLGTVLTGILDIGWGAFDASHQPIQSLGKNFPGQHLLAYVAGVWLAAAGLAILWQRSARIGAAAAAIAYLVFVALWLPRYSAGIHAYGWRIAVLLGISFGLAQQLMLVAPAAIVYTSTASPDSLQRRAVIAARWMLGLPPIVFGLFHLIGLRVFATIVPHWMSFGYFWAALTGIAFVLAGGAICSGIMDVMALRLLALMLLLFEGLVDTSYFYPTAQSTNVGRCCIQSDCDRGMLDIRRVSYKPRRSRTNRLRGECRDVTPRSGGCMME